MKLFLSFCTILFLSTGIGAVTTEDAWLLSSSWMRNYLIDTCAELPSVEFSRIKYVQASEDIGRSFTQHYGTKVATDFTRYMSEHGKLTLSLINAYKNKDETALKDIQDAWKLNATKMCTFLSRTNPYLRFTPTRNLLFDYLKRMISMIQNRINQQWQNDANECDLFLKQGAHIGNVFAQALVDAFPVKKKEPLVRRRLTYND